MPEVSSSQNGPYTTRVFKETPNMSTYLVALVVSNFVNLEGSSKSGVQIRVFTRPGKTELGKYALKAAIKLLDFFEGKYQIKYPLPKLDLIAIPDFAAGAMENWGLVTYRETALLYDEEFSSAKDKQRVATVIAHELSHQWFGNCVRRVDHLEPNWNMPDQFLYMDFIPALAADSTIYTHPIASDVNNPEEIEEIFDDITYAKGAAVLRMLEGWLEILTNSTYFFDRISEYLTANAYGSANTATLWDSIDRNSYNVAKVMNSWIQQPGYPVVIVEKNEKGHFTARQKKFSLSTQNATNSKAGWETPVLLQGDAFALNRVGILEDVKIPLEMTKFLKDETDFVIWKFAINEFGVLDSLLSFEPSSGLFTEYQKSLLTPLALSLGWAETEPNSPLKHGRALMRAEILSEAVALGVKEVVEVALDFYHQMKNNSISLKLLTPTDIQQSIKLPADLLGLVWDAGVIYGDETDYEFVKNLYSKATFASDKERFAHAMASARKEYLIRETLDFAISGSVRKQDITTVIFQVADLYGPAHVHVWNFIRAKWGDICKMWNGSDWTTINNMLKNVVSLFSEASLIDEAVRLFVKKTDPEWFVPPLAEKAVSKGVELAKVRNLPDKAMGAAASSEESGAPASGAGGNGGGGKPKQGHAKLLAAASLPPKQLLCQTLMTRDQVDTWTFTEDLRQGSWKMIVDGTLEGLNVESRLDASMEPLIHCQTCHTVAAGAHDIVGKEEKNSLIKFLGADKGSGISLLVGPSGNGKTTVVSRSLCEIARQGNEYMPVVRYVGLTTSASYLLSLIQSICQQLNGQIPYSEDEIPSKLFKAVKNYVDEHPARSLLVVLDGLDRIPEPTTSDLRWLTPVLEELVRFNANGVKVRFVLTAFPSIQSPLETAVTRSVTTPSLARIVVSELSAANAKTFLQSTVDQMGLARLPQSTIDLLNSSFETAKNSFAGVSPLMVRLLCLTFLTAGCQQPKFFPSTTAECVEKWLERKEEELKTKYPTLDPIRILAALTLISNGISLDELRAATGDDSIGREAESSPTDVLKPFTRTCSGFVKWDQKVLRDVAHFRYLGSESSKNKLASWAQTFFKDRLNSPEVDIVNRSGLELQRILAELGTTSSFREICSNLLLVRQICVQRGVSGAASYLKRLKVQAKDSGNLDVFLIEFLQSNGRALDYIIRERLDVGWWERAVKLPQLVQLENEFSSFKEASSRLDPKSTSRICGRFAKCSDWDGQNTLTNSGNIVLECGKSNTKSISFVKTSANSKVIVAVLGASEVRSWDAYDFKELWTTVVDEEIEAIAVSHTGSLVAIAISTGIRIFKAATGGTIAIVAPLAGTPTGKSTLKIEFLDFWSSPNDTGLYLLASAKFGHLLRWNLEIDGSPPEVNISREEREEEGRLSGHRSLPFLLSKDGKLSVWWRLDKERRLIIKAYDVCFLSTSTPKAQGIPSQKIVAGPPTVTTKSAPLGNNNPVVSLASKWSITLNATPAKHTFAFSSTGSLLLIAFGSEIHAIKSVDGKLAWTIKADAFRSLESVMDLLILQSSVIAVTENGWVVAAGLEDGIPKHRGKIALSSGEEITQSYLLQIDTKRQHVHLVASTTFGRILTAVLPQGLAAQSDIALNVEKLLPSVDRAIHFLSVAKDKSLLVADGHPKAPIRKLYLQQGFTGANLLPVMSNELENIVFCADISAGEPRYVIAFSSGKISFFTGDVSGTASWIQNKSTLQIVHPRSIISACLVEDKKILILDANEGVSLYALPPLPSAQASTGSDQTTPAAETSRAPINEALWSIKVSHSIGVLWGVSAPYNFHVLQKNGQVCRYKLNAGEFVGNVLGSGGLLEPRPVAQPPPVVGDSSSAPPTNNIVAERSNSNAITTWGRSSDGRFCVFGDKLGFARIVSIPEPGADLDGIHLSIPEIHLGHSNSTAIGIGPKGGAGSDHIMFSADEEGILVAWKVNLSSGNYTSSELIATENIGSKITAIHVDLNESGQIRVIAGTVDGRLFAFTLL
ncbi:hypothetical protein HDU97_006340 [Phlyctochytrium planicorne]|nr:hypothetical protein HDU97_006340 [Phlyctochytrium planicorne]